MLVRQQRHQRRTHLAHQRTNAVLTGDVLHVHHDHLDRTQHHSRVAVLQTSLNTLNHSLRLTLVTRLVTSQTVQNVHLTPLRALRQSHRQLLQHRRRDLHHLTRRVVLNLAQSSHSVRNHSRVLIRNHIVERVNETLLLHQTRTDIVQLANTHRCRLTHVRIRIRNALTQRLRQVLANTLHMDATHRTHSQSTNQRVLVRSVLRSISHSIHTRMNDCTARRARSGFSSA